MATVTAIVAARALFRSSAASSSEDWPESGLKKSPVILGSKAVNRERNASRKKAVPIPIYVMVRASLVSKLILPLLPVESTLRAFYTPIPSNSTPAPIQESDNFPLVTHPYPLLPSTHEQKSPFTCQYKPVKRGTLYQISDIRFLKFQ